MAKGQKEGKINIWVYNLREYVGKKNGGFMENKVEQQRDIMNALCMDYITVYHVDLNHDTYAILRLEEKVENAVAHTVDGRKCFSQTISNYIETFVKKEEREYLHTVTSKEYILRRFREKRVFDVRYTTQSKSGRFIYFEMHFVDVSDSEKENTLVLAWRCVDEVMKRELRYQKQLQAALKDTNEMFHEIIEMQSSGVIVIRTHEHEIVVMNAVALQMYEWDSVSDFGGDWRVIVEKSVSPEHHEILSHLFHLKEGETYTFEYSIPHRDGSRLRVISQSRRITLTSGEHLLVNTLTDITYKLEHEEKLIQMSSMDKLTGICNRASGEKRIDGLLQTGHQGMFCLLDVDEFKSINDTYGHMVGDEALKAIADSMKHSFRESDVVMRLGGDEFVVFVTDVCNEETGSRMLKRFMDSVHRIRVGSEGDVCVSLSLGAVLCKETELLNFEQLYHEADKAMYRCKKRKKMGERTC